MTCRCLAQLPVLVTRGDSDMSHRHAGVLGGVQARAEGVELAGTELASAISWLRPESLRLQATQPS